MGGIYIRLPLRKELIFPKSCPFTGKAEPTKFVHVRHPIIQWRMPIPFIGGLWTKPITRVRFPAASGRALLDKALKFTIIGFWSILVIGKFFGNVFQRRDEFAAQIGASQGNSTEFSFAAMLVLGAIALTLICHLLRAANLAAVKIIDADPGMAELWFARSDYAKEFAELNQLRWHDKPFKQRCAR